MENKCYVTIFTPTYNRCDKLPTLYQSLCTQTDMDFEWVIVDDGSTDGTKIYIDNLEQTLFPIRYYKKENGGKHTAINVGVQKSYGKVFAIVDSDDYLLERAVEQIKSWFEEIKELDKFAGVAGQKGYTPELSTGTFFEGEYVDACSSERPALKIEGDKFEVFYTDILRQFPFPEFPKERFLTEAVVWNRISAAGYKLRWHREILYICEYLEGGLTEQKDRAVKASPKGYALYIRELVRGGISLKRKLGFYSYYYKVRKGDASINCIAKELDCSVFILYFSVFLRSILGR